MNVRLEARMPSTDVPDDLKTGDRLRIEAIGLVTAVEDDMIDATPVGGPTTEIPGERTVTVLLELAAVDHTPEEATDGG